MPLQQSAAVMHVCPYCEQPDPVLDELLVAGLQGPHTPLTLPIGVMQVSPSQQSALLVHAPQVATHDALKQMYGGVPFGFGTQGRPLQQFALDAQEPPAATHCAAAHRGTPTLSSLQVSRFWQLPLQQSHEELHDIVESLQTSPSGLHPCGLRQTPTMKGIEMSHVTGVPDPPGKPADPQQSVSFVQRSPTGWQPLAG
jgi:hypothetical protein